MAVIVHRVVGRIRNNGAVAESQGEKDLGGRLTPHLHVPPDFHLRNTTVRDLNGKQVPQTKQANKRSYFWIKHVGDSIHGSVQQKASDEENEEHHVGEDGGEVHDLEFRRGGNIKLD